MVCLSAFNKFGYDGGWRFEAVDKFDTLVFVLTGSVAPTVALRPGAFFPWK